MKKWLKRVVADIKWRYDVHRNRSRHPDLIEREQAGEKPVLIAQEMLMRDREKFRAEHGSFAGAGYPTLHDYLYRKPIRISWWNFKSPATVSDPHPDIHS